MTTTLRTLTMMLAAIVFLTTAKAQSPIQKADSIAFVDADWNITRLDKDAQCRQASIKMFDSQQSISIIAYKSKTYKSSILQLEDGGNDTADQIIQKADYTMGVNGSYFNTRTFRPVTYTRIGGKVYGRTNGKDLYRVNGVIGFKDKKGKKPAITLCDTTEYETICKKWYSVLAAGPVLVKDGQIIGYNSDKSFFTHRHPRTLIGYNKNGEIVMAVIDGRFEQAAGATIEETAIIAKLLGLQDAINLDGGGSSTLWTKTEGVLNHPSDNKCFDHKGTRKIPNCIAAKRR